MSRTALLGASLFALSGGVAHAQLGALLGAGAKGGAPEDRNAPITFQADSVQYDRDGQLITATGHVEAFQNDRVLRADKVTFDRATNVAAASGHVTLIEPDGQVIFSDYAELTQGMKDGVLRDMRAILAENGKLAANGARRLDAQTNELSRMIYSTCNVCAQHPDQPLEWDIRARSAVQDLVNKQIEYHDAVIDFHGWPVAYFPYLSQPDPSQKRASGFLVPSIGDTSHLGPFVEIPYYYVINNESDATITPLIAAKSGPAVNLQYRLRLNEGTILVNSSAGYDENKLGGDIFAKGQFAWDDTWRYGFDINRASSEVYLRDLRVQGNADTLTSQAYIEGFGQGSYARLDARAYQGLTTAYITAELPFVAPRYEYSFVGEPDRLGGRLTLDTGFFNVLRQAGTSTQRGSLGLNWERPATDSFGDLWKLVLHVDSAAYNANDFNGFPNYGAQGAVESVQGMPSAVAYWTLPLTRDANGWGTQTVEPIVQVIGAPNGSSYALASNRIPNEDSFDVDFTDANLFAINRFPGIDRLEGGARANMALHGNWQFSGGALLDAMVGEGFRAKADKAFPVGSGLNGTATDIVSHVAFTPNKYFDITARQRFDHKNGNITFADALASGGVDLFRLSAGIIYSSVNPFNFYDSSPTTNTALASNTLPGPPRNELTLGANTKFGQWKLNGFARYALQTEKAALPSGVIPAGTAYGKMVGIGAGGTYEDECFVFDVKFLKRYTSIAGDHGDTSILFTITLKTVGQFGFHAS